MSYDIKLGDISLILMKTGTAVNLESIPHPHFCRSKNSLEHQMCFNKQLKIVHKNAISLLLE